MGAAKITQTIADIEAWARVHGVMDPAEFMELVVLVKIEENKKDA